MPGQNQYHSQMMNTQFQPGTPLYQDCSKGFEVCDSRDCHGDVGLFPICSGYTYIKEIEHLEKKGETARAPCKTKQRQFHPFFPSTFQMLWGTYLGCFHWVFLMHVTIRHLLSGAWWGCLQWPYLPWPSAPLTCASRLALPCLRQVPPLVEMQLQLPPSSWWSHPFTCSQIYS